MKTITIISFLVALSFKGYAQELLINVDNRTTKSLNGQWDIIIDPLENGYYNFHLKEHAEGTKKAFFSDGRPSDKSELLEYSFDTGEKLHVPGDWNSQKEKLLFYEGTVWYRRKFNYKLPENKRLFIYFGAVNYEAIVYLNGKKIGEHTGGFTPFNFEISDVVKQGENSLVVKVDNKRKKDAIPTTMLDWWNYGGINRRVLLIEEEQTFIRDYHVQLANDSFNEIRGWIQLDGEARQQSVTLNIAEADVHKTVNTNSDGYAKFAMKANLDLWSPENPKLYPVKISSATDTIRDEIGFRSIQVTGTQILLNGSPIYLRGICLHEEAPTREGRAYSHEDAQILLNWAKELNCNYVRLAHYPHNEYMTRLADRMGLLVWSEIPVYWALQWDKPEVFNNASRQLKDMISRDKNKASIIIWSLANETPESDARNTFLHSLAKQARLQDPTRLISAALLHGKAEGVIRVDDPIGEFLDVLGCNEYTGWYGDMDPELFNVKWETKYRKPMIMSELGAGALQGFHADPDTRWSEEFQSNVYKHQFPMLDSISFLSGISPWILKDFRSARRPLPVFQDYYNRKGLISEYGEKKDAFFLLQEYYNKKQREKDIRLWQLKEFISPGYQGLKIIGSPKIVEGPFGAAVYFDGENDAYFLDENPVQGLDEFTIEMLFKPETGGDREQRVLHIGSVGGDRLLLETRLTGEGNWYMDSYIKSRDAHCVLKSSDYLHPLDQWYHMALVVEKGTIKNYVNGKLELEGKVEDLKPIYGGRTSVGVRQNKVFWFKGTIASFKITPKALKGDELNRI